jgi:hypothetical protein
MIERHPSEAERHVTLWREEHRHFRDYFISHFLTIFKFPYRKSG